MDYTTWPPMPNLRPSVTPRLTYLTSVPFWRPCSTKNMQIKLSSNHLLDRDCWTPILIFIQQGETNSSGRVNVGVEEVRSNELDFGRGARVVIFEEHLTPVQATLPRSRPLSGDGKFPDRQVQGSIGVPDGSGDESERVILPPGLPLRW